MNKVVGRIFFWCAMWSGVFVINTDVFCEVYTFEVDIGCSVSPDEAYWYKYSVDTTKKNYRLSLYTIKIEQTELGVTKADGKFAGFERFFINEDDTDERVVATCEGGSLCSIEIQEPGRSIICSPGESLSVIMRKPNSLMPQKYRYIGLLIIEDIDIAEVEAIDASEAGFGEEEEEPCLLSICDSHFKKEIADLEERVLSAKAYDAIKARLKPQFRYSDPLGKKGIGKKLIKLTIRKLYIDAVEEDKGEMWFFADIVPPEVPVTANTVITFSPQPQKH